MEFPGILGTFLWRLKTALQTWPMAALGPFFGLIAADLAVDVHLGRWGSAGVEVVIAPMIAIAVLNVAARNHAGVSGTMMFVLGTISGIGATMLMTRGVMAGSGLVFVMGARHLAVMVYAWASIATEPPVRHQAELAFVRG